MISSLNAFMEFQVPSSSSSFRPKQSWFEEVSQRAHGKLMRKLWTFPKFSCGKMEEQKKDWSLSPPPTSVFPSNLHKISTFYSWIFFSNHPSLKITSWPCLQPGWESPQIAALQSDRHLDSGHVLSSQVSLFGLSPKPTNILQATSNTNSSAKRSCCLTKHKSSTIKPTYVYIYRYIYICI